MKIIVCIPILNPTSAFFDQILMLLQKQTLSCEIVLINSGKKIDTPIGCKVIDIDKKYFNHSNTRNMVLDFEADFYLFMTQDAQPFDEYLVEKLLGAFEVETVVVSYARQLCYDDAHITEQFARSKNYPKESMIKSKDDITKMGIKTFFSSDSCAMYRRNYFRKVGGFTPNLNTSEDMEFAARAILDEKKVAYSAEALVYHSHNFTYNELFNRYKEIGKFFKHNAWIQKAIQHVHSTEKTGMKQVWEELCFIAKKQPTAVLKVFFSSVVKFMGYKVGKL